MSTHSKTGQRVLILSPFYPSAVDPASGTFVRAQAQALKDLGSNVSVVAPVPWAPPVLRLRPRWKQYHRMAHEDHRQPFAVTRPTYPRPPGAWMQVHAGRFAAHAIARTTDSANVDVIAAHALLPMGRAALHLSRQWQKPFVVTVHGSDVYRDPQRSSRHLRACREVAQGAAEVIAVSQALADTLKEQTDVNAQVIHNGVDLELFKPLPAEAARLQLKLDPEAPMLLFVGLDIQRKGLRYLLDAMPRLREQNPRLRLAVLGADRSEMKGLPLDSFVLTPGRVSQEDVSLWTSASTLVVLPSLQEAFGCTLLEAAACARAVVATQVDGILEVVEHGKTGLLVSPRSADALVEAIQQLLAHSDIRRDMGHRARQKVERHLSWRANARSTQKVYESIAARIPSGSVQPGESRP